MAIVVASIVLLANLVLPHRMRVIGVALLLVPQIYVPGAPVSLAFMWTLLTCLLGFASRGRIQAKSPVVLIMLLFVIATAVSLLWALPSGYDEGVATVGRSVVFVLWLREVIVLAREDQRLLDTVVMWSAPGIAVQSVLTVAFRVDPEIEERFLRSELATYLIGPAAKYLYTLAPNNVLDTEKSGGLIVNGNIAALFGGIAALVLLVTARRTSHRWVYLVAGLSATGAAFAGSKAGLVLGVTSLVAITILPFALRRSAAVVGLSVAFVLPLVYYVVTAALGWISPEFYAESDNALTGRGAFWGRAVEMFKESPMAGVGFGGWAEYIGKIEGRVRPPHNVLIATWANSGIFALVLTIGFIVVAVVFGLRVAASQCSLRDCRTAVIALAAILWMFIQSMGENTAIYGESLSMILFALAFGYLYAMAPASISARNEGVVPGKVDSGPDPRRT